MIWIIERNSLVEITLVLPRHMFDISGVVFIRPSVTVLYPPWPLPLIVFDVLNGWFLKYVLDFGCD